MSDVRDLPAAGPRVETGAVRFGDDWPGLFIRGDDARYLATVIDDLFGTTKETPADLDWSAADPVGKARLLIGLIGRNLLREYAAQVREDVVVSRGNGANG